MADKHLLKLMFILFTTAIIFTGCGGESKDDPAPVLSKWTRLSGETGTSTNVTGIAADSSWNSYIVGYTTHNLDGETLTGSTDTFVIKYNSTGVKQWTKLIGVSGANSYGRGIAVDPSGNIYVTGYTNGNLHGATLTGTYDVFVIKYNSSWVVQWTRLLGVATKTTSGYGISFDTSGNVYVTGITTGDLDGETLNGALDVFVLKYNSSGVKQWTRLSGAATKNTWGNGIAVDSSGNSYVCGYTNGSFDTETLTGDWDAFIIKYNSSGVKQWTRFSGVASSETQGTGIAVDTSGNCYLTGFTEGALDGETLTGTWDIFTIKYNSSGTKQWTRLSGVATKSTWGIGISVDSSGNSYVSGDTDGNLGGETLTGVRDVFVIKYDTLGTKKSTKLLGVSSGTTRGYGISVSSQGNTFVTGTTTGNLDAQTITGTMDTYVTTKLNP